jgi:gliding-associated putative ABC transporter substrate-binding component GldG
MQSNKLKSIYNFLVYLAIFLLLNVVGAYIFTTFDLTEDQRFSITEPTKELLQNLDEDVLIKIYLDGELPAGVKRLQKSTIELLDGFQNHSSRVEYIIENPLGGTPEENNSAKKFLADQFIFPNNLIVKGAEENRELLFYTYANVTYKGRNIPVNLVAKEGGALSDYDINNSINLLEYKFADAIQKLFTGIKPTIAFTRGHGELQEIEIQEFRNAVSNRYRVGYYNMDSTTHIDKNLDLLIIAKPTEPFPIQHKFQLDQYIMSGGKVMWLIDKLAVGIDSLYRPTYVPFEYPLDIDDLLFQYGARIQPDLVMDLQSTQIELAVDAKGTLDKFDWPFHPVVTPQNDHPIIKSLDGVNLDFPNTIDTIRTKSYVKKTPVLMSTESTIVRRTPMELSFSILRNVPPADRWNKGNKVLGLLLEGTFDSEYEGRVTSEMNAVLKQINQPFQAKSPETKMLVVSDGDIIKNLTIQNNKKTLPLGFNKWSGYTFANENFLINSIEYMLDDANLFAARGKEVKLRRLNNKKAAEERGFWQMLNILVPLFLLALFGIGFTLLRRRKYNTQ